MQNFFQNVHKLGVQDILLTIAIVGEEITVSFLPKLKADSPPIKPLLFTGKPEDIDLKFFETLNKVSSKVNEFVDSADEFLAQLEEAKTKMKAKPAAKVAEVKAKEEVDPNAKQIKLAMTKLEKLFNVEDFDYKKNSIKVTALTDEVLKLDPANERCLEINLLISQNDISFFDLTKTEEVYSKLLEAENSEETHGGTKPFVAYELEQAEANGTFIVNNNALPTDPDFDNESQLNQLAELINVKDEEVIDATSYQIEEAGIFPDLSKTIQLKEKVKSDLSALGNALFGDL